MFLIPDKAKQFLMVAARVLVVCAAFYFIYRQLAGDGRMEWSRFALLCTQNFSLLAVMLMLIMSFINRYLEILKWQNLVSSFQPITLADATRQVLAAFTASVFTPNGIGEYAGKALFYYKSDTKKILLLNFVNNGIQMFLSVFFGVLGLLYFNATIHIITTQTVGFIFAAGFVVVVLSFFVRGFTIKGYSLDKLVRRIGQLPKEIHRKNTLLGFGRYVIFSHQYYFLFVIFGVHLPYVLVMSAIASVYFLASSLPAFQFFDFAVKGSVAVYFFGLLGVNEWLVVFVATLMWLLNVVVPMAVGSYYVLNFKTARTI